MGNQEYSKFKGMPAESVDRLRELGDSVLTDSFRRVDFTNTEGMNINEMISAAEQRSRSDVVETLGMSQTFKSQAIILSFLRDKHGAETVGEALNLIREAKIADNVITLWIEEGLLNGGTISQIIPHSYPHLASRLEEARADFDERKRIEKMLKSD